MMMINKATTTTNTPVSGPQLTEILGKKVNKG